MYLLVHHQVNDPERFLSIVKSETKFPEGFKALGFFPDVSHKTATCFWEAPSAKALQDLIEPILGSSSKNTYVQIDESIAVLPTQQPAMAL